MSVAELTRYGESLIPHRADFLIPTARIFTANRILAVLALAHRSILKAGGADWGRDLRMEALGSDCTAQSITRRTHRNEYVVGKARKRGKEQNKHKV